MLTLTVMIGIALAFIAAPALAQGSRAAERAVTEAQGAVEGMDPALKQIRGGGRVTNDTEARTEEDVVDQRTVQAEEDTDQVVVQKGQTTGKDKEKGKKAEEQSVANMPETGGFITGRSVMLLGLSAAGTLIVGGVLIHKSF